MADAAQGRRGQKDDYFRTPGLIWTLLVPFGLALVTAAAWAPDMIPYGYLGPVGTFVKYLVATIPSVVKGTAGCAWILHFGEAYYASVLCKSKNISSASTTKWVIQTFFYGVFSLKHLLVYKGKNKST